MATERRISLTTTPFTLSDTEIVLTPTFSSSSDDEDANAQNPVDDAKLPNVTEAKKRKRRRGATKSKSRTRKRVKRSQRTQMPRDATPAAPTKRGIPKYTCSNCHHKG